MDKEMERKNEDSGDGIDFSEVKKFAKAAGVDVSGMRKDDAILIVLNGIVAHYERAKEELNQEDFEEYKKKNDDMLNWFNLNKEWEPPEEPGEEAEEQKEQEPETEPEDVPEEAEPEEAQKDVVEEDALATGEAKSVPEEKATGKGLEEAKDKKGGKGEGSGKAKPRKGKGKKDKAEKPGKKPEGKAKDLAKTKDRIKEAKTQAEEKKTEKKTVGEKREKKKKTGVVKFVCDGLKEGLFKGMKNEEIAGLARKKFDGSRLSAPDVGTCKRRVRQEGAEVIV